MESSFWPYASPEVAWRVACHRKLVPCNSSFNANHVASRALSFFLSLSLTLSVRVMPRHTLDACAAVNGMALDRKLDTIATPDVTQNQHNSRRVCLLSARQIVPERDRRRASEMDGWMVGWEDKDNVRESGGGGREGRKHGKETVVKEIWGKVRRLGVVDGYPLQHATLLTLADDARR